MGIQKLNPCFLVATTKIRAMKSFTLLLLFLMKIKENLNFSRQLAAVWPGMAHEYGLSIL